MAVVKLTHSLIRKINCLKDLRFISVNNLDSFINRAKSTRAMIDSVEDCDGNKVYVVNTHRECIVCSDKTFELTDSYPKHLQNTMINEDTCEGAFQNTMFKSIDMSNIDTSHVTNMANLFSGAFAHKININNIDTSNVVNMSGMFRSTILNELNIENLDISKVKYMSAMFKGSDIKNLTMPGCKTTNLEWAMSMFQDFKSDGKLDLSMIKVKEILPCDIESRIRELHMLSNCRVAEIIWR